MRYDLSPPVIERLKASVDMLELVREQVQLKKAGNRWVGLCPFHSEKSPSFSVNPEKGLYHCFGCGAGGDALRFVMEREGLDFPEAAVHLAEIFRVELPMLGSGGAEKFAYRDRILRALDAAQKLFASQIDSPEAQLARENLLKRGFEAGEWPRWGFGYAFDDWRVLSDRLAGEHGIDILLAAGLVLEPERGGRPYDRFRHRLTFPIRSPSGKIIAFGGRALGEDSGAKYLNSPESEVFAKRDTIYLYDIARRHIAECETAVISEGYFDAIALHRSGCENAVATLGTALSAEHARLLSKQAKTVVLSYDGDAAGRRAAGTGAQHLLAAGLRVAVARLPPGEDPDDVVRNQGPEALRQLIEQPMNLIDFLLADVPGRAQRRERLDELSALIGRASDPVARRSLEERLARSLELRLADIRSAARRQHRRGAPEPHPEDFADRGLDVRRLPYPQRRLARVFLEAPIAWRQRLEEVAEPELLDRLLTVPALRELVRRMRGLEAGEEPLGRLTGAPELESLATGLLLDSLPEVDEDELSKHIEILKGMTANLESVGVQRDLEARADELEKSGDIEELNRLMAAKMAARRQE